MSWGVKSGVQQSFFSSDCTLMLQAKAERDELSGMLSISWSGSTFAVPGPKRDRERVVLCWATCGWCVVCAWGIRALSRSGIRLLLWDRNFNGWLTFALAFTNFLSVYCEGWKLMKLSMQVKLCCFAGNWSGKHTWMSYCMRHSFKVAN